jgi:hypothetical protein
MNTNNYNNSEVGMGGNAVAAAEDETNGKKCELNQYLV